MEDIKYQIKELIISLQQLDNKLKLSYINCTECLMFEESKYFCKEFNLQVPAKVILVGCEKFDTDIPF